ncbi:MAG: alanine dehydrogenase [Armatimonadota bacterium]|nr:alanine dehydrogenase [Armatimonadota bacterium]
MRIAIPREVQDNEMRVGATPEGVRRLADAGHAVIVQASAGAGAGFPDREYREAGATIAADAAGTWSVGDLVLKVKQPTEEECKLFPRGAALFSYTHTETRPWLVAAFLESEMTVISFERVRLPNGSLPLLEPMSRIAGQMAVMIGAQLLQTVHGGPGVMLGEIPGAGQAEVVVIGGGTVGEWAARSALGLGAAATIFELRGRRRAQLQNLLPDAPVAAPEPDAIAAALSRAWLLVNGTTILQDAQAHVVTRQMVRSMPDGAVIIDVTAEPRGAIETSLRRTTHSQPTFVEEGVIHYVVPNIPGVVPRTATLALAHATLPYALKLAKLGVKAALRQDEALAAGLLCTGGEPVADDVAAQAGR